MRPALKHPLDEQSALHCLGRGLNDENTALKALRAVPMLATTIAMLHRLGLIFARDWRPYVGLSLTFGLNLPIFIYMATNDDALDVVVRTAFMLVLWFNSNLRGFLLLWQRTKFERFLHEFIGLYHEIIHSGNAEWRQKLIATEKLARQSANINLLLGILTVGTSLTRPLIASDRTLPYGSDFPGIDEHQTPFYEIIYAYQILISPVGCFMYIPFGNLIISFILFAIVMCHGLQQQIKAINAAHGEGAVEQRLKACIDYYKTIVRYISIINELTNLIFLIEFLAFGALLCALMMELNIAASLTQAAIAFVQITMVLMQLFTLYWVANELSNATSDIALAVYDINWFDLSQNTQRDISFIIMRSQKSCNLTIGKIYPMSMNLFQSLLNASYSFFTLLRRFSD